MKQTLTISLLLLSTLPAFGQDYEKCIQQFQAEVKSLGEQFKQLDEESKQLSEQYKNANTKAERDAIDEAGRALRERRKALQEQGDEAARRQNRCMGIPVTKREAQKAEADMKARISKMEQDWKAAVKPYENMPVGPSGTPQAGGNGTNNSQGSGIMTQGLISIPPVPEQASAPPASAPSSMSPFGSGRTPQQRAAALAAVNAELDRMPYILPKKENAPSKADILRLAGRRNASARKAFLPDELSEYSRTVTWIPAFDGLKSDGNKAREYSLLVAAATNHFQKPRFVIALGTAVFSLDPQSIANANNLASAIIAGGELLYPAKTQAKELALYGKDAESCFLYAMAISMKDGAWTDDSLTAIINLGNLYIDMNRLDEARSLFQVARKLKPFSWDAALGMAAYFHAVNQPDKALTILEDDNLDQPVAMMVAKKSSKVLEKSEPYAGLPVDASEELYEKGIETMNSEPIATAADFIAQIDQSERNKMRYFVENLPPKGSFKAPSITKLTQYASLRAIWGPQGISAMKDFLEMLQIYSMSSFASNANEQLKMLSRLGIKLDPGIDLNDVARNPHKYANQKNRPRPKAKVDKSELKGKLEEMRKQAETAKRELATGKTATLTAIAAQVDPFFTILQLDPRDYADPMNIIIQKHNFAVLNRKFNLYNGYLYSINKKRRQQFNEIAENYQRKVATAEKIQEEELKRIPNDGSAEAALQRHNAHTRYFNACNAAAEQAFGSAANITTTAYVQKIKPQAEAFYYDVIRHVGLITDPEVRDQKDYELRRAIYSALVNALQLVGAAHGSFKYHPEWECGCDVGQLMAQREAELEARKEEENARIMRNKAAKAAFDSGEIPESTPLWKKLDAYGTDLKIPGIPFLSGRISCARTVVKLDTSILPIPDIPQLFGSMTRSEITGATKYEGGVSVALEMYKGAGGGVGASCGLSGSVSTDGNWNVSDYSVTPSAGLSVKAGQTGVSVGGKMTFGPNGVTDSDFSAGISRDMANGYGMEGKAAFEASTKRGCTLSGKVTDSIMPKDAKGKDVDKSPWESIPGDDGFGKSFKDKPSTDKFHKKDLWSGKYKIGG